MLQVFIAGVCCCIWRWVLVFLSYLLAWWRGAGVRMVVTCSSSSMLEMALGGGGEDVLGPSLT